MILFLNLFLFVAEVILVYCSGFDFKDIILQSLPVLILEIKIKFLLFESQKIFFSFQVYRISSYWLEN